MISVILPTSQVSVFANETACKCKICLVLSIRNSDVSFVINSIDQLKHLWRVSERLKHRVYIFFCLNYKQPIGVRNRNQDSGLALGWPLWALPLYPGEHRALKLTEDATWMGNTAQCVQCYAAFFVMLTGPVQYYVIPWEVEP